VDDRTVGLVLRALRRRRGWRQADLAAVARCSQSLVSNVERGHLGRVAVETLRSLFAAVEARVVIEPRWRGAELDRLLDSEHASVANAVAGRLERARWEPLLEVTYAIGPERGAIDILGVQAGRRAAFVCEVKTDIPAAESVGRKLDEKRRLAPLIVRERLGWTPAVVGAVLAMPESVRLRRLIVGPAATLGRSFPIASRGVSVWLRDPVGPLAATWFLSDIRGRNARRVRLRGAPLRAPRVARDERLPSVDDRSTEPEITILR
jgi:transcriptional regulator with XRE-family HTH domain